MSNSKLHDLNGIIKSALMFMEHRRKIGHVSLRKKFTPKLPRVRVDADDILLVIVNLLINAFDSMPEGGKLLIESQCCKEHDAYVQFSISDTGYGIEKKEINKIFDPFFTMNTSKERNGLGLAISKTIIENHSGKIKVASSLGKGTTFTVYLPAEVNNNDELGVFKVHNGNSNI